MAANKRSIGDVWLSIKPTIAGVSDGINREIGVVGDKFAQVLEQSIRQGINQGTATIGSAFDTALAGITFPTSQLANQFDHLSQGVGQQLAQTVADAVDSGLQGGVTGSSSAINSLGNQVQQQVSQGFSQGAQQGTQSLPQTQAQQPQSATVQPPTLPGQNPVTQPVQQGAVDGFKKAGPAILAIIGGLGIGAVVAGSINSAMEKEDNLAVMTASLGLDPKQAEKAGAAAGELYVQGYGESMEDVTNASEAAMSSFKNLRNGSSKEIEEVSKRALNMAKVFEVDVARSTQVASQMITSGWANDSVQAMDLLSASMQKVPENVRDDIMDAVDEYGPFMKELGLEGERGMSLLVKGAEKGMYGIDKTGDALKEFTIRSKDMSTASAEGYELIGLNQKEMSAELLKGGDEGAAAFQKIITGLTGMKDPVAQQTAALALFGTPLEDLSVNEIPAFLTSLQTMEGGLGNVAESAKAMDEALGGTASQTLEKFKRSATTAFSEAMVPIIKEMQPLLEDATKWFKENQDGISEWVGVIFDGFQSVLIPAIQTVTPVLAGLFTWLSENEEVLQAWVPTLIGVGTALVGLSVITSTVSMIGGLIGVVRGAATALWAGATAGAAFGLSFGWLALIVGASLAIGVFIGHMWNMAGGWAGITEFWGQAFGGMVNGLMSAWGGFIGMISDGLGHIGNFMTDLGRMIANFFIGIANTPINMINGIINGINALAVEVPDWVPEIGGNTFGFAIPNIPTIPALATGADVMGPTVALLGEKDPETVVDRGLMNRNLELVNARLAADSGSGAPVYITVTPAPGMDEELLAEKVADVFDRNRRR